MLLKGFKHSEETKRKISISLKGRKKSKKHRENIALSKIGNTNGYKKGKKKPPFSEEHKKKLAITGFQKGGTPWNKGKKMPKQSGEKHLLWRGNKVSYGGLHQWVKRYLGTPDICEHCGMGGLIGKKIHWANKSREYKRELSDWIRLCAKCHYKYDSN
jgi:hypothetical protein